MVGTRDTPPAIQDGISGSQESQTANMSAISVPDKDIMNPEYARSVAREAYQSSTNWLNAGRRAKWNDSLRAFQSLHPSGSKYLSTDYSYRSRIFHPKTRSMVRRSEATTAAAFFSNEDVVSISAMDDDDKQQQASAEINKRLLQYRLTKTIPWFLTLCGARQDADIMGICIGKAFWKYAEKVTHTEKRPKIDKVTGMPTLDETGEVAFDEYDVSMKMMDHPWVDLVAPENFRFDPAADWRNPVATSPYLIELIPMYIADVREKIDSGEWLNVATSSLMSSTDLDDDVTRRSREQGRIPGKDHDAWKPRDFDICWVRENIIRFKGKDWHYYTLASAGELLSNPKPLEEMYLHGARPYVCGFVIPEAHKVYPSSKIELVKDLQQETNDVRNLRLDNVKLALNPRQFVRAGSNMDVQDAKTFMPGKVVISKDPRTDIVWDRPPEVTASSYQEQDRINMDFDELTGGVSNSSIQANKQVYEAVGNMQMMQGNGTAIEEYEMRVFAETFVEPIISQLVKLEQAYETDPIILAIAGQEAQLYQKFGMNEITDQLLQQDLTVKVNVGIGSTNPKMKLENFATAAELLGKVFGQTVVMGVEFEEVVKEVFGLCGYKDGERFFKPGFDPAQAAQQMQQKGGKQQANPHEEAEAQQAEAQRQREESQQRKDENQQEFNLKMQEMQMQYSLKEREMVTKYHMEGQRDMMKHLTQPKPVMTPNPV